MNRTLKPRKCKSCGREFQPISSMAKACSVPCALALVAKANARKEAKAKREEAKVTRAAKEKLKRRADHLSELQDVVNLYVRLRDAADGCISCDRPATWHGQWHASHFKSVGSHPGLRFNLLNIHKACSICNKWKGGNYAGYKPKLEQKIGKEAVEWLEGPAGHDPLKLTVPEIIAMKAEYRAKIRELKKQAESNLGGSNVKTRSDIRTFCEGEEKNAGLIWEVNEHGILNCENRAAAAILDCLKSGYSVPEVFYAFVACALEVTADECGQFASEAFDECHFNRFTTQKEKEQIALTLSANETLRN